MSINWNWKDKIGVLRVRREFDDEVQRFDVAIYEGNADLIFIYEFNDGGVDKYSLYNFYCDLDHFKRCMTDTSSFDEWQEITFYKYNTKIQNFIKQFYKLGIRVVIDRAGCEE